VLEKQITKAPLGERVICVESMDKACFLGWWLAREHHVCLKSLMLPVPVDSESATDQFDGIDTIDIGEVKAAILDRLGAKGPLSRRELSRSFHHLQARDRDQVIKRLENEGLLVSTASGKLVTTEKAADLEPTC
jgi:hypothetical protein